MRVGLRLLARSVAGNQIDVRLWPLIAVPWAFVHAPTVCRAEAPPPAAHFTWELGPGSEACLPEADLRAKIAETLGGDPFSRSDGPIVRAGASARGDELVAIVRLRESEHAPEAFREIHAPAGDCTALTDAVALAVTLALSSTESPKPVEVLVVSPPPMADRGAMGPAPRSAPGTWALLAEAVWTLGALPRPEAGIGVEARYAILPHWAIAAGGDWLPDASEAGQFSVGLARARLGLCAIPFRHGSFSVIGCATAEGGAVRIGNEAAVLKAAGSHAWFGAGLSARASARLGERWVVEGGAGAVAPTSRPVYATPSCPLVGFQEPPATLSVLVTTGVLF